MISLEVVAGNCGVHYVKSWKTAPVWCLATLKMWDYSSGCLGQLFPLVNDLTRVIIEVGKDH